MSITHFFRVHRLPVAFFHQRFLSDREKRETYFYKQIHD
eukprot:UN20289